MSVRAAVAAVLVSLVALLVEAAPASAAPREPSAASVCDDATAVRGRLPVLLVHGFVSSPDTWSPATRDYLGGNGQRICTSLFDYASSATDWVTSPNIGRRLAQRIVELAAASKSAGGPGHVVVVAHSMGGLAVRCAADPVCSGVPGAAAGIGAVVTFGTPTLGTSLKGYGLSLAADVHGAVWGATCAMSADVVGLGTAGCEKVRAFGTSDAARAFTPGSRQLATLPALPSTIPVLAIAGSTRVVTSFWGHGPTIPLLNGGDLVVAVDSATAGGRRVGDVGGTLVVDCGELDLGLRPAYLDARCWHGSETNDKQFLAAALNLIGKVRNADEAASTAVPAAFVDGWGRHSTAFTILADGTGSVVERTYAPCTPTALDCQFNAVLRVRGAAAAQVTIEFTRVWYTYGDATVTPTASNLAELEKYFPRAGESASAWVDTDGRLRLRMIGRLAAASASSPDAFTFCGKATKYEARYVCGA